MSLKKLFCKQNLIYPTLAAGIIVLIFSTLSCSSGKKQNSGSQILSKKFDFGSGDTKKGYTKVTNDMSYDSKRGYGFISDTTINGIRRKQANALTSDFCTSQSPFYFFVDIPEGNHRVKIYFGDSQDSSITTVKAESRRLMLHNVKTDKNEFKTKTFTVNVRRPVINKKDSIKRKPREYSFLNWDDKLSIEFNNKRPCINAIEIKEANDITNVFLAGNSTVVDQEYVPWAAWGQMLPVFFDDNISISNYAESGEAMLSFIAENRLKKITSQISQGDYLFIQFGHNDQTEESSAYLEANTGYKDYLGRFVDTARKYNANPVLITPMHRRKFDKNGEIINTHGKYPQAVREVAKKKEVPLIDLNKMSEEFYEALGVKGSKKAFVHYPANTFPGQNKELSDNSHHSIYGAHQLAKCVIKGIRKNELGLTRHIRSWVGSYNPSSPLPYNIFDLPFSPSIKMLKPEGN